MHSGNVSNKTHNDDAYFFKDIIVIGNKGEYAESIDNNPLPRLIKQIQFLMHESQQADRHLNSQYQERCITRLILNESSLYTRKPLHLQQYKMIIHAIAECARELSKNIHFVFATLPILWPTNLSKKEILHSVGLYVQCGKDYKIYHFDKNLSHPELSLEYTKKNAPYYLYGSIHANRHGFFAENYYDTYHAPQYLLNDTGITLNDVNQYQGAIKLTIFDQPILVVNEICYEHNAALGRFYAERLIQQLKEAGQRIPELASHVLVSNTIEVIPEHL